MTDADKVVSTLEKNYIVKLLKQGQRMDGRKLFDFRNIKIRAGFLPKAEGSAEIYLGETRVVAGVKYDVGSPYEDNPDEGVCTVAAELLPMASPMFESGPPSEESIQLARVVDRGIRHGNTLDVKSLCIEPHKSCYILFVDSYIMDHYGNLIDATAIAAIVAMINVKLPGAKLDNGKPVFNGTYSPLKINEIPLSISFGKVDNIIFVDPSIAEEMILDGSLSIAVDESGNVNSMQKFGIVPWTQEEVLDCCKKAIEIGKELRAKLNLRQYAPKM